MASQPRYILSKSFIESQKPMVFIEAATALANANTTPTEAPNSIYRKRWVTIPFNYFVIKTLPGPNDRDIIKYTPPPLTSPLVLIADSDSVVITHTTNDMNIISSDCAIPACATTHASRRKSITPQMFNRHGISTPWIHPSLIPWCSSVASGSFVASFKLIQMELGSAMTKFDC